MYLAALSRDRVVSPVVKESFADVYGSFGGEGEETGRDGAGDDGVG